MLSVVAFGNSYQPVKSMGKKIVRLRALIHRKVDPADHCTVGIHFHGKSNFSTTAFPHSTVEEEQEPQTLIMPVKSDPSQSMQYGWASGI